MARGMPMRPAGGGAGRAQPPPRRAAQPRTQPARQQPKQPPKQQPPKQQPKVALQRGQSLAVVRRAQQQRLAAANKANRQRLRQQMYLREAHSDRQQAEAELRTVEVQEQVEQLESILPAGLRRSARIDLDSLRRPTELAPFDPGQLANPAPEPTWEEFAPGRLTGRWGSQSWKQRREAAAREAYEQAREQWDGAERERKERLAAAERAHAEQLAARRTEVERYHARIARVAAGLRDRDPQVVESFLRTVLRRVPLPRSFPRRAEVTHQPRDEQVVLRVMLPDRTVVPEASGYEYAAAADEIRPVPRPADETGALYRRVLAQTALLVVRDVFDAEPRLSRVTLHGLVNRADPGAEAAEPDPVHLVSLTADREAVGRLDLEQQPAEDCLVQLDARMSAEPYAYQPVDPVPEPA